MSASTVIIDGNTIDTGVYGATSSGYDTAVLLRGTGSTTGNEQEFNFQNNVISAAHNLSISCTTPNATITNNTFRNINASGRFISFNGAFVEVKGNKFYRGANSITSYIQLNNAVPFITDNYFDSSTNNGSNEALVVDSVSVAWNPKVGLMERNINQIYSKMLGKDGYVSSTVGSTSYSVSEGSNFGLSLTNVTTTTQNLSFNINFTLSDYFPLGSSITGATLYYLASPGYVDTAQPTIMSIYLRNIGPIDSNFVNIAGSYGSITQEVTDAKNYPTPTPYAQFSTAQSVTATATNDSFKISTNQSVCVSLQGQVPIQGSVATGFSPVLVGIKFALLVKAKYSPS